MDWILEILKAKLNTGAGSLLLFFSAFMEYVFPPYPGDMATLFGAFMALSGKWSFWMVLFMVTSGSVLGALVQYFFGKWLGQKVYDPKGKLRKILNPEHVKKIMVLFNKHANFYILINRFLPAVRAGFFIVAGASRISIIRVLILSTLSSLLWNLSILSAGYFLGLNWEKLKELVMNYQKAAWIFIIIVGIIVFVKLFYNKKRNAG